MTESPVAKRARRDAKAEPADSKSESSSPEISRVVHVRNLSPRATEADLVEALSHFGSVSYVTCMYGKGMALVEFEEVCEARTCIEYANSNIIYVAGQPAQFNFSTAKKIQRIGLESDKPNHVLVITIYNAVYPINVNVIHQICSPYGNVKRIAIIRRNIIQALVEYESAEEAKRAKRAINGADIYTGCCTLKVEFGKPDAVIASRNTLDSWDYTKPSHEGDSLLCSNNNRAPLLEGAPVYYNNVEEEGCVVMVYGTNQIDFNCEKLFNLFCIYGNCERVKFMKTKPDTAMVQMGSTKQANIAISYIHGLEAFGARLTLKGSKQTEVHLENVFSLPDGSPSSVNYAGSRNHRYSTPEAAAKNRIVSPVKALHWFNAPPDVTEERIWEIFRELKLEMPVAVSKIQAYSERSSKGIIQFTSVRSAVEAIILANHTPIVSPVSKYPYILKLTFVGAPNPV